MAQLTINQCQTCSKILAPGVTECPKCHTKHAIQPTVVNPLRFTAAEAADYRAQFQEQVDVCPKDSNAQFAIGLTYLGLRNYELSDEHFIKAVQLTPSNPDVYYYTALSMFHHRSVMNLSKAEMDRIEQWLHTAVQMQPKRKYLILQMVLRQGMASMGLNVDTDKLAPAELLKQARQMVQEEDELYEIEQHVLITDDKTRFLLNKIVQADSGVEPDNTSRLGDSLACYNNFCATPRGNEEYERDVQRVKRLTDVKERIFFFQNIHMPDKPIKPSYFSAIWSSIKWAFCLLIVWFILSSIAEKKHWLCEYPVHIMTVQERMADVKTKGRKRSEIVEIRQRHEKAYERDSTRAAECRRLYYYHKDPETKRTTYMQPNLSEEEIAALPKDTKYMGMNRKWTGWVGLVFVYGPAILWIILVISYFVLYFKCRKDLQKKYDKAVRDYHDRPTIADYKMFCALYAGPNDVSIIQQGDFVAEALRQAHISELDIQNGNGKVFFSCYLRDVDENGCDSKDPAVTLRNVVIRICVAMRDSIIYMHAVWDSTSGDFPIFEQERLLYSQIANFRNVASYSRLEVISHSNIVLATIVYAYGDYPSLICYQSYDPDDELTYHTTRTSDFNEFYNSLVKMHTAYNHH